MNFWIKSPSIIGLKGRMVVKAVWLRTALSLAYGTLRRQSRVSIEVLQPV